MMISLIIINILILLGLPVAFIAVYINKITNENQKIKMINNGLNIPQQRDFDVDMKYLNHLVDFECSDCIAKFLIPLQKQNGTCNCIDERSCHEATQIASKSVLDKLSKSYRKILSYYVDEEEITEYVVELVYSKIMGTTLSLNQKFFNMIKNS